MRRPTSAADRSATPLRVALGSRAEGWFTGAELPGAADANLAHHRPHLPVELAAARGIVGRATGTDPVRWHLMRQVHGAEVGVVTADVLPGAELRGVDALVTAEPDRALVVLVADCLPILVAGERTIAAVHAGWRGLEADVIGRTVEVLVRMGEDPAGLHVVVGPSIDACCYEVGPDVAGRMASVEPDAVVAGDRGRRPHVDLFLVATRRLVDAGVPAPQRVGSCTRCGSGPWFSHRRDADAGRQAGLVRLIP